jgi:dihydroneopterin aldolase
VDHIRIDGLEVFAHHGVLPHEREVGQRFVIDVDLGLDLSAAVASDALDHTVDYGKLADEVVAIATADPVDLIETVAGRIADHCLSDERVQTVEVTVHKPQAPLRVVAREVSVRVRRDRP